MVGGFYMTIGGCWYEQAVVCSCNQSQSTKSGRTISGTKTDTAGWIPMTWMDTHERNPPTIDY
jgi:hypothetical protein